MQKGEFRPALNLKKTNARLFFVPRQRLIARRRKNKLLERPDAVAGEPVRARLVKYLVPWRVLLTGVSKAHDAVLSDALLPVWLALWPDAVIAGRVYEDVAKRPHVLEARAGPRVLERLVRVLLHLLRLVRLASVLRVEV